MTGSSTTVLFPLILPLTVAAPRGKCTTFSCKVALFFNVLPGVLVAIPPLAKVRLTTSCESSKCLLAGLALSIVVRFSSFAAASRWSLLRRLEWPDTRDRVELNWSGVDSLKVRLMRRAEGSSGWTTTTTALSHRPIALQ